MVQSNANTISKKVKSRIKIFIFITYFLFLFSSIFFSCKIYYRYSHVLNYPEKNVFFDSDNTLYCHFSVDDCIGIFYDLTNNESVYSSAFDNPLLAYLKDLHNKYGMVVSLYVFYYLDNTGEGFCLSDTTGKFSSEFESNSDWLRFGFHAKDSSAYECLTSDIEDEYYVKTIKELGRIVGKRSIDDFLRLDRYVADTKTVEGLRRNGVNGLLIAPDPHRISYALSENDKILCYSNDWFVDDVGMKYTPTDIQIEKINNDEDFYDSLINLSQQPRIEIFTHEWILDDLKIKKYMEWYAFSIKKNGVDWSFSK